jgi:FixJ family two-component response regulator
VCGVTENSVVAIVDDDPDILQALTAWLGMLGYATACHTSAESIKQHIRLRNGMLVLCAADDFASSPSLAGAILDINLPGASGIDLANHLRSMSPHIPLTIITALRDDERIRYGNMPHGVTCLRKPFDLGALEDALFPLMS